MHNNTQDKGVAIVISDVFTDIIHYTEQQTLNTAMETVHVFTIIFIDRRGENVGKKINQKTKCWTKSCINKLKTYHRQ